MSILTEAQELIHGKRQQEYGHPSVNLQRIADLWSVYAGPAFTPDDVAIMMALVKVARLMQGYKHDSAVDLCGYIALLERLRETAATTPEQVPWDHDETDHDETSQP
ncbi:MAG: hypothetical protein H0U59_05265 [Gemmatimonadaceae bacterium]|nr:hypothetical protein [Gemmatimonadaceae bacterium]